MPTNAALQAVHRSNRLFIALSVICLLIVAAGFYFDRQLILSFFAGSRTITLGQLNTITDASTLTNAWVNVTGSDAEDTGWQQTEESDSGDQTVTGSYIMLAIGERFLLVQVPNDVSSQTLPRSYTGLLINMPDDVTNQVMADIQQQYPDVASAFFPVMLDTSDFHGAVYVALVLMAVGIVIGLVLLVIGTRRSVDPYQHPIMKTLARYGDAQTISEDISRELAVNHTTIGSTVHLTPHWLVSQGTFSFQAARLQDIAWAYESITRHRTYGITTRRTYEGYIYDRFGKLTNFPGKEPQVKAGLQVITQAAPWIALGYSAELAQEWKNNRAQFLASVDARRKQLQQ